MRFLRSGQPALPLLLLAALVALAAVIAHVQYRPIDASADRITGCAWQTECWHDAYIAEFWRDGLIDGMASEGDFLGLAYRIEAVRTPDLITSFSILASVGIFLLGLWYGRLRQRRTHTLDVLLGLFMSDTLAAANAYMADVNIRSRKGELALDGDISGELDANVICILDFYEFICDGAFEGSLSRSTIRTVRGGAMRTTWETCERYIRDRRGTLRRPTLYAAFERFVRHEVGEAEL